MDSISPSKELWLQEGLDILARIGPNGLTIEELSRALKKTKGSFYHHFGDRANYTEQLLDYWEARFTRGIIASSEKGRTPDERLKRLTSLVIQAGFGYEAAIRAWAIRDPAVRQYQERVDRMRFEYIRDQLIERDGDKQRAVRTARLMLCAFIGAQQVIPPLTVAEQRRMYTELRRL